MKKILSLILAFTIITTMFVMVTPAFAEYTPTAESENLTKATLVKALCGEV